MLVFIDESGCSGFKFSRGSTEYFVVAMVIFRNAERAAQTEALIHQLQQSEMIYPEFKFSNCSDDVKDLFFERIRQCRFDVRAIVIHKPTIYSQHLREHKDRFYSFFVKSLVSYNADSLVAAHVRIDGSGDRVFKRELCSYLARQAPDGCVSSVRFANSKSDRLVQLADMCVGAIARSYREDRDHPDRWRAMLAARIADVWEFQ